MVVKFNKQSSSQNYTFFYHYHSILHQNVEASSFQQQKCTTSETYRAFSVLFHTDCRQATASRNYFKLIFSGLRTCSVNLTMYL